MEGLREEGWESERRAVGQPRSQRRFDDHSDIRREGEENRESRATKLRTASKGGKSRTEEQREKKKSKG